MKKFKTFTGRFAYIALSNIDTDMIIPKQYLKTIKKSGLGKYLFSDLRYDAESNIIDDFVLNKQNGITILITGQNFGCGSSREHAAWSLLDFGINAIIAPSFADIFYNNCFKNGILPITLDQKDIDSFTDSNLDITVDLVSQTVKNSILTYSFEIENHRKKTLLQGLDDIEKIFKFKKDIALFEQKHFESNPWLKGGDDV